MSLGDILKIGLGVAAVALSAKNTAQLEEMKAHGGAVGLMQAIQNALKNQVFNFRKTAEGILEYESKSPVAAAGAMKLLEYNVEETGIKPEYFDQLADKDYVAATLKLIRDNSTRLMSQLTSEDQRSVQNMVSVVSRLPDLQYYIDNYQNARTLRTAISEYKKLQERNGFIWSTNIRVGGLLAIGAIIMLFSQLGSGLGLSVVTGLIGLGLGIFLYIRLLRWQDKDGFNQARKTQEEWGQKVNLSFFNRLDTGFKDVYNARKMQSEAQVLAQNFFGDAKFLMG